MTNKGSAPSLEELITSGIEARLVKDGAQWLLGGIANEVEARYGTSAIAEWATGAGVGKSSAYRYAHVRQHWGVRFSTYAEISEAFPALSWAHFDAAAGSTVAPPLLEDSIAFLERASDEGWTCEQARAEARGGKGEKPSRVLEVIGDATELRHVLRLAELTSGAKYKMVITLYADVAQEVEAVS